MKNCLDSSSASSCSEKLTGSSITTTVKNLTYHVHDKEGAHKPGLLRLSHVHRVDRDLYCLCQRVPQGP